ncbi:SDR family NAD(P)-dependent oxidoreductase [Agrobacterium tumefaciens]|uniref:SDR family NAD(P)-dependent oxidoreductase n=1 Tax=Agrobacterium tumefaciens TaxID=358 RepID=UPI0021D1E35C|nr:SDR family oxidoreductase [Agrobacterium tumefaciens]UXS00363.1 SDR family oxidoreductase [Agrobacterium tumefaciens]
MEQASANPRDDIMIEAKFPDLQDEGVLITGGGSGIGAALVEAFAVQGARVSFIDIAAEPSRALAERLSATTRNPVRFFNADLRKTSEIGDVVKDAARATDGIKVLVNNAAWDDRHDIDTVTESYWDNNQSVNLKQMFFVTQAALPFLRQAGEASIINFSSISFLLNMGDLPSYATAKAGIIGLTKSLAGRLGPENIRVNALLPGMIVTERQKELWLTDDSIVTTTQRQCLKRTLLADDLAGPCLFLASSTSRAITAQSIIVDGGLL